MDCYDEYFNTQTGDSYTDSTMYDTNSHMGGGVGRVYIGSSYQRGHGGIGSFLVGAFRRALPLFARGAQVAGKAVGKEALRSGMNIVSDVVTRKTPIKVAFCNREREFGRVLKRKAEQKLDKLMKGSGYKIPLHGDSLSCVYSVV